MDIFRVAILGIILVVLLAFRFKSDLSRFEINRLAEHSVRHKTLAEFLDIYPGLVTFSRILALIAAIFLTVFATLSWGILAGGGLSFVITLLSYLLAKSLRSVTQDLIESHLHFFNKYFAWTEFLGKLIVAGDEPRINSEHELVHLVREGDFLDDDTKNLLENSLNFREKTVREIMTLREKIAFVHSKDALTPGFIDELFNSGHKIFPVVQGGLDHVIGFLILDDILPIEQEEKILTAVMRKAPPPVANSASLETAFREMCEYHTTALMVEKDDKIIGLVTLSDIVRALFHAAE